MKHVIPICCSCVTDKECSDAADFKGKMKWESAILKNDKSITFQIAENI